ncbi:protein REVEILLE 1-like isoform X2 [Tasmannia lanceolata]|uniref:protein REVEILLE 1-like isoform X2 n=1 Tax=Tasmannia lanceolata TaxID=3420 RepID=UPI004063EC39
MPRNSSLRFIVLLPVVRESGGCNSDFVKSIEIPPPRPKRKPIHPYPRKLVHSFGKPISAHEQLERSTSPIPSVSEPENRSPTSVLSAIGLDTMGSTCLNPSTAGLNSICLILAEQENRYPSPSSSTEEENRFPSPVLVAAGTSLPDKSPMNFETDYKDNVSTTEGSSVAPTTSLKLFGRTVLVTDSHRPVAGNIPKSHRPVIDIESHQENLDMDVQKPEQTSSPRDLKQRDFSLDPCKSAWNLWSSRVLPLFYCPSFQQEGSNSAESTTPLPWLSLYGTLPFPLVPSNNMNSRETPPDIHMGASDDKEVQEEGSGTDSDTDSISEVGVGEKNSYFVEASDKTKEPIVFFCLKASENSAFSCRQACSKNSAKGFVPYKRCVAERDVQQSQIGSEEREAQRIRLCL